MNIEWTKGIEVFKESVPIDLEVLILGSITVNEKTPANGTALYHTGYDCAITVYRDRIRLFYKRKYTGNYAEAFTYGLTINKDGTRNVRKVSS